MRWLLDEMLPRTACVQLVAWGHDAVSVYDAHLGGAEDALVFEFAVRSTRIIVTENFADYALLLEQRLSRGETCVPVVFVRKADFPRRSSVATRLAKHLHTWSEAHPEPYLGLHWP
jgi:predicted nuclease of predicted toxin-antitoxin system